MLRLGDEVQIRGKQSGPNCYWWKKSTSDMASSVRSGFTIADRP
jgi:hypothetical protein